MKSDRPIPLAQTAWLHERLLVGKTTEELSSADVRTLLTGGVEVLLTLEWTRSALDALGPENEEGEQAEKPVRFECFPLRFDDMGCPDPGRLRKVLQWLAQTVEGGTTVYLHSTRDPSHGALVAALHMVSLHVSPLMARRSISRAFGPGILARPQRAFFAMQSDALLAARRSSVALAAPAEPRETVEADAYKRFSTAAQTGGTRATGEFVVGVAGEGFCSLLPLPGAPEADDQNLDDAERFGSFAEAWEAAGRRNYSVFAVIDEGGRERIEEVLIDPSEEEGA